MLTLQEQLVTFTNNTINRDSEDSNEGRFHLRPLESFFTERKDGDHEISSSLQIRAQSQWGLTNKRTIRELIDSHLSENTTKKFKYNLQYTHRHTHASTHRRTPSVQHLAINQP